MSRFVVDSRSLLAVRDTLGRLHGNLTGMHLVIDGYWGSLGGGPLEGELEHFCGTWHYGVTQIAGEVHSLMERLTDAAAAYERIEQRMAAAHEHHRHPHPRSGSGVTVIGSGGQGGSGSGSGSGVTVIGGGGHGGAHGGGGSNSGSGSGVTVIGGGAGGSGAGSGSGSGVTVIDEKRRPADATDPA